LHTLALLPLHPPLSSPFLSRTPLHSFAAKPHWVGCVTRQDVLAKASNLTHIARPLSVDARRADDTFAKNLSRPVTFHYHRLDPATLRIDVYAVYARSFSLRLNRRQLGLLMTLTDRTDRLFALHWASHEPHYVWRGWRAG